MDKKQEENMIVITATLVMFATLINPVVSMILSGAALIGLAIYQVRRRRHV
jgi:hypothetical protein